MKKLWLAWEDDTSIRSRVLADELGAHYEAITAFDHSRWFGWLRYPVAGWLTLWTLLRRRPDLVVVQNPSVLLAFEAAVLRALFGYRLVIDLHTPFLNPVGLKKRVIDFLHEYGLRHCDAVVVTNEAFRTRVRGQTGVPVLILADKVPQMDDRSGHSPVSAGGFNVVYICTFSNDEPWPAVIEAARALPSDVRVYITGRSRVDPAQLPPNVVLTGYLSRADYQELLHTVDAVMVLTTAEENLVCGGYEAVAAGKPLIVSGTDALRGLYRQGAIFTTNDSAGIARSIERAREQRAELAAAIVEQKRTMESEWDACWATLLAEIGVSQAEPAPVRDTVAAAI